MYMLMVCMTPMPNHGQFLRRLSYLPGFCLHAELYHLGQAYLSCRGEQLWRAKPWWPEYIQQGARETGNISTIPYLRQAASQMMQQSCGEGWLLQPKIMDMPDLEYRWEQPFLIDSIDMSWNMLVLGLG